MLALQDITQISEIDVFGKAGSTSARTFSSPASESTRLSVTSSSDSESKVAKGPTGNNENKESSIITSPSSSNHAPVARNDIVVAKSNKPEVVAILGNDNDPDGDKLGIVSITSTTRNGAFVKLNDNGTVTISPRPDFAGVDKFTYTVSDGRGKSDNAQVSVVVKRVADIIKGDQTDPQPKSAPKNLQEGHDDIANLFNNRKADLNNNQLNDLAPKSVHNQSNQQYLQP